MTDLELTLTHPSYRPLPGHCVIRFDDPPTMSGLIHIPQTAQHAAQLINRDKCWTGRVVGMTRKGVYGKGFQPEDFQTGDRVAVMLGVGDLDRKVVLALNTRVYAVILGACMDVTACITASNLEEGILTTPFTSDLS